MANNHALVLRSFRQGSFRGWLLRIVTNTSFDLLRKAKCHLIQSIFIENEHGEDMETAAWLVDPNESGQRPGERNEIHRKIHKVISRLAVGYRSVLLLAISGQVFGLIS